MSSKFDPKCHIGETHGIYTIIGLTGEKDKYGHWIYQCVCNECGFEKHSHYGEISGKYKAEVCNHLRANGEYRIYGYRWGNKRLGQIFQSMISRCYNENDKNYRWYGNKGIQIDKGWMDNPKLFEEWSIKNGYSDNLTIDRVDADKDYCPDNCRWLTLEENTRRAGNVNWITVGDETLTGRQWAEKLGLGLLTIDTYIRKYGLDLTMQLIKAMLKEPPSAKYRKSHQTWFYVYGIQV